MSCELSDTKKNSTEIEPPTKTINAGSSAIIYSGTATKICHIALTERIYEAIELKWPNSYLISRPWKLIVTGSNCETEKWPDSSTEFNRTQFRDPPNKRINAGSSASSGNANYKVPRPTEVTGLGFRIQDKVRARQKWPDSLHDPPTNRINAGSSASSGSTKLRRSLARKVSETVRWDQTRILNAYSSV